MRQFLVHRAGGTWYVGRPEAHAIVIDPGQSPSDALANALQRAGTTREELAFQSPDEREQFDADFPS
jgi:glyoxylase-like metal-dependent hydrolase (beta-lactamase superfamily II)